MKVDLAELMAPAHTAIVTQECQGAVMGPDAGMKVLADDGSEMEIGPGDAYFVPPGTMLG